MLANFTERHGQGIVIVSGILLLVSLIGVSRLRVENSFIDYFKQSTEIYQGMKVIDQSLGGTTPLDVTVDFVSTQEQAPLPAVAPNEPDEALAQLNEFDEFEEFDEFDEFEIDEEPKETYWFTPEKMDRIKQIHAYLDGLPQTGKVLSMATTLTLLEDLNHQQPLDSFELALLNSEAPDRLKDILMKPYVSTDHDQARFSIRVRDSEKSLQRNELLKQIKTELAEQLALPEDQTRLSGMMVLYNNMLQSLFTSQILTLGLTVLALTVMFLILFRSLKIALIAIVPNLLSVGLVLGAMGWLAIPLDMMTITIAAISIGIAVDDTIHYIHRFKEEFHVTGNYIQTLYKCHGSIGHAMYYTSVTIIIGFSILALSNFIPSIYFGLLTGLAMLIALLGALTLLPQLIILVQPFGKETYTPERSP